MSDSAQFTVKFPIDMAFREDPEKGLEIFTYAHMPHGERFYLQHADGSPATIQDVLTIVDKSDFQDVYTCPECLRAYEEGIEWENKARSDHESQFRSHARERLLEDEGLEDPSDEQIESWVSEYYGDYVPPQRMNDAGEIRATLVDIKLESGEMILTFIAQASDICQHSAPQEMDVEDWGGDYDSRYLGLMIVENMQDVAAQAGFKIASEEFPVPASL